MTRENIENPLAYWAVVEHHRNWLATDGCHFAELRGSPNPSELSFSVAKRIVKEYSVARNISRVSSESDGLSELISEINKSEWPECLNERADICIKLAQAHQKKVNLMVKINDIILLFQLLPS